jgi:hypothetical protein
VQVFLSLIIAIVADRFLGRNLFCLKLTLTWYSSVGRSAQSFCSTRSLDSSAAWANSMPCNQLFLIVPGSTYWPDCSYRKPRGAAGRDTRFDFALAFSEVKLACASSARSRTTLARRTCRDRKIVQMPTAQSSMQHQKSQHGVVARRGCDRWLRGAGRGETIYGCDGPYRIRYEYAVLHGPQSQHHRLPAGDERRRRLILLL